MYNKFYLLNDTFILLYPLSDKYPSLSPYNYCALNPVMLVDPDGRDIDPDAPGYKNAKNAATPGSDSYQPAFAKLYNEWEKDGKINVKFHDSMAGSSHPDAGGAVEYGGTDKGGAGGSERDVYNVFWDSSKSTTEALGTSAMFEESQHLKDGLDGKFNLKSGTGIGIMNEVEAKQWVVDNISGIKGSYRDGDGAIKPSHYGHFKNNPNDLTPQSLGMGLKINEMHPNLGMVRNNLFGTGGSGYERLYNKHVKNHVRQFLPKSLTK